MLYLNNLNFSNGIIHISLFVSPLSFLGKSRLKLQAGYTGGIFKVPAGKGLKRASSANELSIPQVYCQARPVSPTMFCSFFEYEILPMTRGQTGMLVKKDVYTL